jgi:hypothetical protein
LLDGATSGERAIKAIATEVTLTRMLQRHRLSQNNQLVERAAFSLPSLILALVKSRIVCETYAG